MLAVSIPLFPLTFTCCGKPAGGYTYIFLSYVHILDFYTFILVAFMISLPCPIIYKFRTYDLNFAGLKIQEFSLPLHVVENQQVVIHIFFIICTQKYIGCLYNCSSCCYDSTSISNNLQVLYTCMRFERPKFCEYC